MASTLVKNLVRRRGAVHEVKQRSIRGANGSDGEIGLDRLLCTLLPRRWRGGVLEVEPVIAVEISKCKRGHSISLSCDVAVGRGDSFDGDQAVLDGEQASEEYEN